MDSDETKFLPTHRPAPAPERKKTENEPFEFGDRTIFQLRNQDFEPQDLESAKPEAEPASDEFGTVVLKPGQALEPVPAQAEPATTISDDPMVRIEQKLDAALRQLHSLQQRLESLDATIAKVLMR
ncbi:MAG TPA: hypothetical protein VHW00_12535 [Thermoanaerobaculia bacterium]|nr:hypothetical protein [Thermoanaerobaculia bacterium]